MAKFLIKQIFLKLQKVTFYNIIFYIILLTAILIITFKVASSGYTLIYFFLFLGIFVIVCFLSLIWFIDGEKFVIFYVICIPIIPLYQNFFPSEGRRTDINIEILFLEVLFLFALIVLYLIKKNTNIKTGYKNDFRVFNHLIFIWIVLNLISLLFSINVCRSFMMFLIGILGPALIFYLIANKIKVNYKMLYFLILSLFASGTMYVLIGLFKNFRQLTQIGEFIRITLRGNYGTNETIGAISFMIPLMFLSYSYYFSFSQSNVFNKIFRFVLFAFRVFSITWILFSVSRWGYATFLLTILLVILFDRGNLKIYQLIPFAISLFFIFSFFRETTELIIRRFTHTNLFTLESVYQASITNLRLGIWRNAWECFKEHIVFGIGLGNHLIISPMGYTTAHNMFLNILVERGIFVCIIFLGITVYFYKSAFKFMRNSKNYRLRRLSKFLTFSITIFLFWTLVGTDLIIATGYISAIKAHYFNFILGLQFYIMKLDSLNPENTI